MTLLDGQRLLDFIRTGRLLGVAFGMSPEEVTTRIGRPEAISVSGSARLWRFGAVQVSFWKRGVSGLAVYFSEDERGDLSSWQPVTSGLPKQQDARASLAARGIGTIIDQELTDDEQFALRTMFGLVLTFESGEIRTVQHFMRVARERGVG